MQPLSLSLDGPEADPADESKGTGRESKETEKVGDMNPLLKRSEFRSFIGQGPEAYHRAVRKNNFEA